MKKLKGSGKKLKRLEKKLKLYGIHPKIVKWVESFLVDKTQSVVLDRKLSNLALIISGVLYAAVLRPVLCLIFVNDVEHCILHCIVCCFAVYT